MHTETVAAGSMANEHALPGDERRFAGGAAPRPRIGEARQTPLQVHAGDASSPSVLRLALHPARRLAAIALLGNLLAGVATSPAADLFQPGTSKRHDPAVTRTPYRGWTDALTLENGLVEAVVVPEVGRIMQFRFVNEEGVLWEDPALAGRKPDPRSKEWMNFGGDKTWPAPQADWERRTGRAWPPPATFDAMPVKATLEGAVIVLRSPVDPHYGIRTERRIELEGRDPVLRVTTRYLKVRGKPVRTAIWVITQLKDPVRTFALVPTPSIFADGFGVQSDRRPPSLQIQDGLLSLTRDRGAAYKIGTDAAALLWAGDRHWLLLEGTRDAGREYPDGGSSAEIYTNPDPKAYVELEILGPLAELKSGQQLEQTLRYHLLRRGPATVEEEARKILGRTRSSSR